MRASRRSADKSTSFLFAWMPHQLSFIVFTLSLVFFLNYLFVVQSIFAPNIVRRVVRCKVPAGANHDNSDESITTGSTEKSSKMCQLASGQCQLTNVPLTDDVDECVTMQTWNGTTAEAASASAVAVTVMATASASTSNDSHTALAETLIQCCLDSRTTATASVKLINDTAMPPQLTPLKRSIVTTNFNDNTTRSPNSILNNTNTILNYSKSTSVHSHLNRNENDANGTINLTKNDAFVALYTTNSDKFKLNINSVKFRLENDSCIRHNSIECSSSASGNSIRSSSSGSGSTSTSSGDHQNHQHKQHCDSSNCRSCSSATLVQCYR